MRGKLTLNHKDNKIMMDRTFAKVAKDTFSEEYAHLQQVRKDYPTYTVEQRTINRNKNKETYKGLTYEYMRLYISTHEPKDKVEEALAEFDELILISQCHSQAKRYPVIKNWFLEKYPAIKMFGMPVEEPAEETIVEMLANTQEVVELPQAS